VVGASDYIPHTLWTQLFLAKQGYTLEENILEQDNESAMRFDKNGRMSAGQKSRHINIRYFWIKDRTEANKVATRHCLTLEMLADFFTKPLQGHLFRRFRDVILGHCHVNTMRIHPAYPLEERGGENRSNADEATIPRDDPTVDDTSTHVHNTSDSDSDSDRRTGTRVEVVNRKRTKKASSGFAQKIVSSALS
jgi:hypothetical protein